MPKPGPKKPTKQQQTAAREQVAEETLWHWANRDDQPVAAAKARKILRGK